MTSDRHYNPAGQPNTDQSGYIARFVGDRYKHRLVFANSQPVQSAGDLDSFPPNPPIAYPPAPIVQSRGIGDTLELLEEKPSKIIHRGSRQTWHRAIQSPSAVLPCEQFP